MKKSELIILIAKDIIRTFSWKIRRFMAKEVTPGVALTRLVEDKIEEIFDERFRVSAKDLLREQCGMGLPLMHTAIPKDYDRIRLAVIKLSGGTVEGLEKVIHEAKTDWRDVLINSGFGYHEVANLNRDSSEA